MDRVLYTAEAVVEGGRAGHGRTSDGKLDVGLSIPKELSGDGGSGTNPEQLFAVGYAACFQSALLGVARATWMPLIRASPRVSGSVRPDMAGSP
jgi:Ohr subfamily peroxiredoxin